MKPKIVTWIETMVYDTFGPETGTRIMAQFQQEFQTICAENPGESRAVRVHTVGYVYPAIGFYRALQNCGQSQEEAYGFLYRAYEKKAEAEADQMRRLLKIPGLYRTMPVMWKLVTRIKFGTAAGFRFHFYPTGWDRVKFDMLQCPYCQVCERYGCRELVPVFCHTDDVCNEDVHPKLLWNRTKTMGGGDDCCDFDVIVKH